MHRQTTNEVMTESCQLSWVFDTGHRAPSLEGYLLTRVAHDAIVVSPGHFLTGGSSTGRDDRLNSHLAPVAEDHRVELKPDKTFGGEVAPEHGRRSRSPPHAFQLGHMAEDSGPGRDGHAVVRVHVLGECRRDVLTNAGHSDSVVERQAQWTPRVND